MGSSTRSSFESLRTASSVETPLGKLVKGFPSAKSSPKRRLLLWGENSVAS